MGFDGLRVLSLESRRAREMEKLIRAQGGDAFVAPSMREIPLGDNPEAFAFAEKFFAGHFDMMILLTGVGARLLNQIIETRWPAGSFIDSLRGIAVVARGSKPMAVLREWNVPAAVVVPEPNTWREILVAIEHRPENRIAVQEYGRPADELIAGLVARGATVTTVPVYQWDLPEDTGPLKEAARRLAAGEVDVVMLTTSVQLSHLLKIANEMRCEDEVRAGLSRAMIASVGPTTSEALIEAGLKADFEPSHPKMGFLVNEAAGVAHRILGEKKREG